MRNLERDIAQARETMQPAWSGERSQAALLATHRKRHRRIVFRSVSLLVTALAVLGLSRWVWLFYQPTPESPFLAQTGPSQIRFQDGSSATLLTDQSWLKVEEDPVAGLTRVIFHAGRSRFEVVPNPSRRFRVEAGPVTVEVVGTVFTVEREELNIRVWVERGRVRIETGGGHIELGAGQRWSSGENASPPRETPPTEVASPSESVSPKPQPSVPLNRRASEKPLALISIPSTRSWKELAQDGLFEQAFALVAAQPETALPDDVGDLLLMADVARLASHPKAALAPLSKILRESNQDPRAPLAAFTLGRILLDELGNPREAAGTFRQAWQIDPEGPMAQDALAREVEAWFSAGEVSLARACAENYLQRYPGGRRSSLVRHYGGLE